MNHKILISFFVLLSLTTFVNATTQLPNANTSSIFTFDSKDNNNVVDNIYLLNISDTLTSFTLYTESYNYPYTLTYRFSDNKNNFVDVEYTYYKIYGIITDTIYRNVSVYQNNQVILLQDIAMVNKKGYSLSTTLDVFHYDQYSQLRTQIDFDNQVIYLSNRMGNFIGNAGVIKANLSTPIFINKTELPIVIASNPIINYYNKEIILQYQDLGKSYIELSLTSQYNSLSFPFRILFLIIKGILSLLNNNVLGFFNVNIISDNDYLTYQQWFLEPLTFLDYIVKAILTIIHFILTNGIIWFISISLMIIFIYSYATSSDIFDCFSKFAVNTYQFFSIIINAVKWLFDSLLIAIMRLFRG